MEYIFVQDKIRIDQVLKNKQTTKNFTPIRAQKKENPHNRRKSED